MHTKKNTFGPAEIITTNESISQTDTKFMVQLATELFLMETKLNKYHLMPNLYTINKLRQKIK